MSWILTETATRQIEFTLVYGDHPVIFAFVAFDDDRGYLNLYDLSEAAAILHCASSLH
jgi:hypothetical protein